MRPRLDFSGKRRVPLVLQTEAAECGLACLAMVASYYGYQTDLATLRDRSTSRVGQIVYGILAMGWRGSAMHWHRYEMAYKGQGRLIFAGSSGFDSNSHLIWIIHAANDTGYR